MTTILVVDDSVTMRKCLEITFAGSEFELVSVNSAQAALEKVKTASPLLVIADVSLPPNDGYELCSTIKLAADSVLKTLDDLDERPDTARVDFAIKFDAESNAMLASSSDAQLKVSLSWNTSKPEADEKE